MLRVKYFNQGGTVKRILYTLLLVIPFYSAQALDFELPELVPYGVTRAYIPQGFDSNDATHVVVEGTLPNTCYRVGPGKAKLDTETNKIIVEQTAYVYKGAMCMQMIVPFNLTLDIGILNVADYTVKDAVTSKELGTLPVSLATSADPDDYNYATISDAYVDHTFTGERAIILHGQLPGNCWYLSEKRVIRESKDVLTVLPILAKREDVQCNDAPVYFTTTVELPEDLAPGRHLLHVRSQSGAAVNKLFDM